MAISGQHSLSLSDYRVKESFAVGLEAALALGDLGKVEELLGIIRSLPPGRRTHFLQAHSMRFEARLAELRDDPNGAERGFKAAVGLFRGMAFPFWLAVTLLEYGKWLTAQGRSSDGIALLERRARSSMDSGLDLGSSGSSRLPRSCPRAPADESRSVPDPSRTRRVMPHRNGEEIHGQRHGEG